MSLSSYEGLRQENSAIDISLSRYHFTFLRMTEDHKPPFPIPPTTSRIT